MLGNVEMIKKIMGIFLLGCAVSNCSIDIRNPSKFYWDMVRREADEYYRFQQEYVANKLCEGKTDDEIEQEIKGQPSRSVAISFYILAVEYAKRPLRPLVELLEISGNYQDCIKSINNETAQGEIRFFIWERVFRDMSIEALEFEIIVLYRKNKNLGSALHSLACNYSSKNLRKLYDMV